MAEPLHKVWAVTDVSYDEPCVYVFDNPLAANACADYYNKDGGYCFVDELEVYGSFIVAQEGNDGTI